MQNQINYDKAIPNLAFRGMSFVIAVRDKFTPPEKKLEEVDIKSGFYILDYGCGPGSYSIAAAKLVGDSGKVYAADIHPLAIRKVQNVAAKKGLLNIETIKTNCATGLKPGTIDVVLCFDVIHQLSDQDSVLAEFYQVLKPNGILCLDDHHMNEDEIISKITKNGHFKILGKTKVSARSYSYRFTKISC